MCIIMQITIVIVSIITLIVTFIAYLLPKKLSAGLLLITGSSLIVYLLMSHDFIDAWTPISMMLVTFFSFSSVFDRDKRSKRQQLKQKIAAVNYEIVELNRESKRIIMDIILTGVIGGISLLCLLFVPDSYLTIKYLLVLYLLMMMPQFLNRLADYFFTTVYMLPEQQVIFIISLFEARELPMDELSSIRKESEPDVLRLHPGFTFLAEQKDYTFAFSTVLRLSFPGETICLTPTDSERWFEHWQNFMKRDQAKIEKPILPIWHISNIKRLLWKGYFAIAVKGIAAYTGLLIILTWLHAPWYAIIIVVFLWWLFNMYIADRMLINASDAKKVTAGEIYDIAQEIFLKAGIIGTRLYVIDSSVYNGLATGMHIGKGTIMLTTATTKLSKRTVEAILAHEAIHIKKRDVMINQIGRMAMMAVLGLGIYLFFDELKFLTDHLILFIVIIYIIMLSFPISLSVIAQWTEIRADYLGAKLLGEGSMQMADGLKELALAQDKATEQGLKYSTLDEKSLHRSTVERGNWFVRFLEFQFFPHPPLYWRIQQLRKEQDWSRTKKSWLAARFKESLRDFLRYKSNGL
ncbi:M56 family metallopeptidase [Virgibacillus pantothenticus]|nr:M56 family metallopeptidase [Virgibacillus pantothenticus]MED3737933.1 M56 family metallopeptidase [Virgibacillus pantothenticus]